MMGETIRKAVGTLGRVPSGPGADADLLGRETAIAAVTDITTNETDTVPGGIGCPSRHGAPFELSGPGPSLSRRMAGAARDHVAEVMA